MFDFPQVYIWLSVGALLLIIEALGLTNGFLLGMGIAAFVTAAFVWIASPEGIWGSIGVFSLLSVTFTWAYWKFFFRLNNTTDAPSLNQRAEHQIGTKFLLTKAVADIPVNHFIGDTRWSLVSADATIAAGTEVVVRSTDAKGSLVVEPVAGV